MADTPDPDWTPQPGAQATLNAECPWPERRGLTATVVHTDGCGHLYPVHGLREVDVVVYITDDPLEPDRGPQLLPNGQPWSCVLTRDCLTPIQEDTPDG